jgi:hypothetical protein
LDGHQQIDDLGPRRRVQSRSRLVEYHQLRPSDDGAGDADALLLPGTQLRRILVEHLGAEPDTLDHLEQPAPPLHGTDPLRLEGFEDRSSDTIARVERLGWLLENQLDLAAKRHVAPRPSLRDVLAIETDRAAADLGEAEYAAAERGLARAAFADQRHGLALAHGEADAVHGPQDGPRADHWKGLVDVLDLQGVRHRLTGK